MPRILVPAALILSMVLAGGCVSTPASGPVSYAPVAEQPPARLGLESELANLAEKPESVRETNHPEISVDVRFVEAPHARLLAAGFGPDEHLFSVNGRGSYAQTLSAERFDELMRLTQTEPQSSIVDSPTLRLCSGQTASMQFGMLTHFVQDQSRPKLVLSSQPFTLPSVGEMSMGRTIRITATLDGDDVVFDNVLAKNAMLLGIRECSATVATANGDIQASWEEPYLLVGKAKWEAPEDGEEHKLRLPADKAVVLPMVYQVEQSSAASARAMAKDGKVVEHYRAYTPAMEGTPASLGGRTETSPLSRQCLVVIRARSVNEVASAR